MGRVLILAFFILGSLAKNKLQRSNQILNNIRINKYRLGADSCMIVETGTDSLNFIFLSLHEDEQTSKTVFHQIRHTLPGVKLIELKQKGTRLINYRHKGKDYKVDPNRIFTNQGLCNSLKLQNGSYPSFIKDSLSAFSKILLDKVISTKKDQYIVAIHNNSEGNFSINTFKNSSDTEEIFIKPSSDLDDFVLVTKKEDYVFFKSKGINVILQSNGVKDDGSLSVYAQHNQIPYINLEVQDGHSLIEKEFLNLTYTYLKNKQHD